MRSKVGKSLWYYLLMGSLWLLTTSCEYEQIYDLNGLHTLTLMPEELNETLSFDAMKRKENFQPSAEITKLDIIQKAWIRYDLPEAAVRNQPALMLSFCSNIDKIAWGDQLLVDFNLNDDSALAINQNSKPHYILPLKKGPQSLYFRIIRSHRSGLLMDCRELKLGPEIKLLKRFATFQIFETMTSWIMLFLAAVSFLAWLLMRQSPLLIFSLFSGAIGLTFFATSYPMHFVLASAPIFLQSWLLSWSFFAGSCLALLFFMALLSVYLIQIYIDRERSQQIDRSQNLEEYNVKLAQEVKQRSEALKVKAEELEQSNFDLEEKNILLSISHKRLEDLIMQKDALLKKVAKAGNDMPHLLLESLQQLYLQRNKTALQNLSIEIHKVASQLEPLARLYSSNPALKPSRIWLLEPEQQLIMATKMALGGSRVDIRSFMIPEEFVQSLAEQQPDLTVISADFADIPPFLQKNYPDVATLLTTRHELSHHIDFMEENPNICHVIYQDDDERALTQKNLLVTVTKILSNDIFGLEKYLNWGVDVKEYIITSSENRAQYLEVLEADLTKAGVMSSHIRNAMMITDEILMNAIYDAPVNRQTGLAKYNHLSRRVAVELEPTEYGKLRFAFDGSTIALSVDDPFGALKRATITRYLKSCFDGYSDKINEHEGKGGGGMGLFQIISTADLMITNIKAGERTEIIALIHVNGKTQGRKRHGSFHYFVER